MCVSNAMYHSTLNKFYETSYHLFAIKFLNVNFSFIWHEGKVENWSLALQEYTYKPVPHNTTVKIVLRTANCSNILQQKKHIFALI